MRGAFGDDRAIGPRLNAEQPPARSRTFGHRGRGRAAAWEERRSETKPQAAAALEAASTQLRGWRKVDPARTVADLGFVEVCHRDCRVQLARNPIAPSGETLGEVTFQLPHEIRDVEFRMYVNAGSGITLSSVSITQQ